MKSVEEIIKELEINKSRLEEAQIKNKWGLVRGKYVAEVEDLKTIIETLEWVLE